MLLLAGCRNDGLLGYKGSMDSGVGPQRALYCWRDMCGDADSLQHCVMTGSCWEDQ